MYTDTGSVGSVNKPAGFLYSSTCILTSKSILYLLINYFQYL